MYCSPIKACLIVFLFQENKSFGARTICIHPLMYVKPCQEQPQDQFFKASFYKAKILPIVFRLQNIFCVRKIGIQLPWVCLTLLHYEINQSLILPLELVVNLCGVSYAN
jgi:hypothetical protein